jgi:uncharacterized protein YndB with AHSA1/START domain
MDKSSAAAFPAEFTLHVRQEIQIEAPAEVVFAAILEEAGPGFAGADGKSMQLKVEPWPGGRWYRDLGNGKGHLWGHVQVIKPPTLLEITGPMFMSYPVASHLQYRLAEKGGVTTLTLTHHAFGPIAPEHREGVNKGWGQHVARIKERARR